jgi:hypothetical protein
MIGFACLAMAMHHADPPRPKMPIYASRALIRPGSGEFNPREPIAAHN